MRIQRIIDAKQSADLNTGTQDFEKVDIAFVAAQGATVTTGFPVCLTTTANSNDGIRSVLPASANHKTFTGISLRDVPDNAVGLARAYGFVSSVRIFAHGASVTIAAGEPMGTGPSSNGVSSTGLLAAIGPIVSMEAIGAALCSPGGYAKGFARLM